MEFPAGGQLDLMAQKFCEAEQAEDPGRDVREGANRDMLQAAKEACRLTPVKVKDGWLNLSGLDTQARTRIDRLGLGAETAADLCAGAGGRLVRPRPAKRLRSTRTQYSARSTADEHPCSLAGGVASEPSFSAAI